ncbi:TetR/AcrR family transcriptional regulator [Nonomuraea bangladeshensis]|uniref:TetR/AcrR family transcriptional regulator n=1 Tax=Nonomuraea bangladeshensis TaxID=404385 RepID=UPI003C2C30BD
MRSENEPTGQKSRSFIEDARRAQIVAAAIDVIADVGFAQASLARIARQAGISKGLISYHFAGKEELMTEVVVVTYTAIADHVLAAMQGVESPRELLRTHVLSVAAYMREQRKGLKALGQIFGNLRDADGRPRFGIRTNDEIYRSLENIYRAGQAAGEFRDFDVRVMAVTHSAAVDAMFAYWVEHPEHDLDEHARQLADLLERACAT